MGLDNGNINARILKKSELHVNEYGTNNFCCTMKKWRDKICLDKDFITKKFAGSKTVKNIYLNSYAAKTDRLII